MTTLSSYLPIANNVTKWLTLIAQRPENATQTDYFTSNIGKVQNANDLISNPRLFNYAMTAFGLGDMTYATGMMKQVLQQGVSSSTALANTLNNPRIQAFAKAFDFASQGSATTTSQSLVTQVVNAYTENALEADQGQQDPGVQLALYFQQHAPSVTSIYGILGDKNLLNVVQTALNISPATSQEPIDTQATLLGSKLHLADFQDPIKLQQFITRFAAMYDVNNGGADGTSGASNNVILYDASGGGSAGIGVDTTMMLKMQSLPGGL